MREDFILKFFIKFLWSMIAFSYALMIYIMVRALLEVSGLWEKVIFALFCLTIALLFGTIIYLSRED